MAPRRSSPLPVRPRTADELRRAYIDYFVGAAHTEVASASLIPHDPTVLFTVAGMVPFKSFFTGDEATPYQRATTSQKCVRAGGKHNDLDDVGRTARHLVFFEMLGNFSFGDYFKEDAIRYGWEFTTEVLGFDPDRLWVTVHESDDVAEALWHDISGLPMERIQRLGDGPNFWQMGPVGPCGPCSEIFIDMGPKFGPDGGPSNPDAENRFLEFWNLVFMQFDQSEDGARTSLPKPSIDTGLGLERTLSLIQGVDAVWETDLMTPIIDRARSLTGATYVVDDYTDPDSFSLRVLAEHARSTAMLIGDDVFPSNNDRGYVLRRIMRRAIRHAYRLGSKQLVMPSLVETAIGVMAGAYPAVRQRADHILNVVTREEEQFRRTLERGSVMLDDEIEGRSASVSRSRSGPQSQSMSGSRSGPRSQSMSGSRSGPRSLSGAVAFELHDTYGFQLELTREIAAERGVEVDEAEFSVLMNEQRSRAKAARKNATTPEELAKQYRSILDASGQTQFLGYETEHVSDAKIVGVVEIDDSDGTVEVFLDRTPFYAESGGQVGDTGTIRTATGLVEVTDTTSALPGLTRHIGRLVSGTIEVAENADAEVDHARRAATRRNHTATHLLHWALREVLGTHVKQAGSLVGPDRLRFDFSHYDAVTHDQIRAIEDLANGVVLTGETTRNPEVTKAEAEEMGAIAFFGDKYGEKVRVLNAGPSLEFCGGTHVGNVGQIGPIRIVSEGSIGSNLRRVEASTGQLTIDRMRANEASLAAATAALRAKPEDLADRIARMLDERKDLERQLAELRRAGAGDRAKTLAADAVDGIVIARVDGISRDDVRDLAVAIRDVAGIRAVVLGGMPDGGGVALVAAVAKDSGLNASALIADAAKAVGGGGGKDVDLAIAGGRHPEHLDAALALARNAAGLPVG